MRRTEKDDTARRVRSWVDGALDTDRAYTPAENAEADATTRAAARDTNRHILLDRSKSAIDANLTTLQTAQAIQSRIVWTNPQRDDALRFLAGRVIDLTKQNNALIRLVVAATRADALDATE